MEDWKIGRMDGSWPPSFHPINPLTSLFKQLGVNEQMSYLPEIDMASAIGTNCSAPEKPFWIIEDGEVSEEDLKTSPR